MTETPKNRRFRVQLLSRTALFRLTVLAIILGILMSWGWFAMIQMPGESYWGQLPRLTQPEVVLLYALKQDVEKLAGEIGRRNYLYYKSLTAAADFLTAISASICYS